MYPYNLRSKYTLLVFPLYIVHTIIYQKTKFSKRSFFLDALKLVMYPYHRSDTHDAAANCSWGFRLTKHFNSVPGNFWWILMLIRTRGTDQVIEVGRVLQFRYHCLANSSAIIPTISKLQCVIKCIYLYLTKSVRQILITETALKQLRDIRAGLCIV